MLVDVNAVVPFAAVEALEAETKAQGGMVYGVGCKIEGYVLREADAVW